MFGLPAFVGPRMIGAAVLVIAAIAAWLYVSGLQSDVELLTAQKAVLASDVKTAQDASNANLAAIEAERQHAKKTLAAMIKQRDEARRRADALAELKKELEDEKLEDGPIAPVLRSALDRLLGIDARENNSDGGKASQATCARSALGLPCASVPARKP